MEDIVDIKPFLNQTADCFRHQPSKVVAVNYNSVFQEMVLLTKTKLEIYKVITKSPHNWCFELIYEEALNSVSEGEIHISPSGQFIAISTSHAGVTCETTLLSRLESSGSRDQSSFSEMVNRTNAVGFYHDQHIEYLVCHDQNRNEVVIIHSAKRKICRTIPNIETYYPPSLDSARHLLYLIHNASPHCLMVLNLLTGKCHSIAVISGILEMRNVGQHHMLLRMQDHDSPSLAIHLEIFDFSSETPHRVQQIQPTYTLKGVLPSAPHWVHMRRTHRDDKTQLLFHPHTFQAFRFSQAHPVSVVSFPPYVMVIDWSDAAFQLFDVNANHPAAVSLLLCWREKVPTSPFFKDYLPLDILKSILCFAGLF